MVVGLFMKNKAYIMAMFDSPSFTPGGSPGSGAMNDSRICSVMINASSRPTSVIFFVFLRVFSTAWLRSKRVYYQVCVRSRVSLGSLNQE